MKMKYDILIQTSRALAYIHANNIVHRDVKSHNVLMTDEFNVKLCDFGLAKYKRSLNIGHGQFSGTPSYMAPELFNKKPYSEKVDIFAFGTMIWEVILRKIPFEGFEVLDIRNSVVEGREIPTPNNKFPSALAVLIHSCRNINPDLRPSFSDITEKLISIRDKEIKF